MRAGLLRRTPPASRVRDDPPVDEQLAAPDAPRLAPCHGRLEAGLPHVAPGAERLGASDVVECLREEERGQLTRPVGTPCLQAPFLALVPPVLDGVHRFVSFGPGPRALSPLGVVGLGALGCGAVLSLRPEMQKGRRVAPAAW